MAEIQIIRAECAVVVVKETDFDALLAQAGESEQLRANLSLAEEGLANYAQEIASLRNDLTACQLERDGMRKELERIRQERLTWAMVCTHNCTACDDLDDVIRGDIPQSAEHACTCDHEDGHHFDDGNGMVRCRSTADCKCAYPLK